MSKRAFEEIKGGVEEPAKRKSRWGDIVAPTEDVKPLAPVVESAPPTKSSWLDKNVIQKRKTGQRTNAFQFISEGSFIKQEEQMKQKMAAKSMKVDYRKNDMQSRREKQEQVASSLIKPINGLGVTALHLKTVQSIDRRARIREMRSSALAAIPRQEWWDGMISKITLPATNNLQSQPPTYSLRENCITKYVEHRVPIKSLIEPKNPLPIVNNTYLTEKEKAKLRRRKRQEKEQIKQDQIRMGLIPPPPPKVKLTNLMRVLKDPSVANPTMVEAKVREQMKERKDRHEKANLDRQIESKEKHSELRAEKWKVKPNEAVQVCVFLFLKNVSESKGLLFKLDRNAHQLHLRGRVVLCEGVQMVVVQGSGRSVKRFSGLLSRRVRWRELMGEEREESEEEDEEEGKESGEEYVRVLWKGFEPTFSFGSFRTVNDKTLEENLASFRESNVERYLELAIQKKKEWDVKY